jgi:hypothetical protein
MPKRLARNAGRHIFLDHLFRIPGIRSVRPRTITSNPLIQSYELPRHRRVHATAPRLAGLIV